jgi:hypothetical protein
MLPERKTSVVTLCSGVSSTKVYERVTSCPCWMLGACRVKLVSSAPIASGARRSSSIPQIVAFFMAIRKEKLLINVRILCLLSSDN